MNKRKVLFFGIVFLVIIFFLYQIFTIISIMFENKGSIGDNSNNIGVQGDAAIKENIVIRNGDPNSGKLTFSCNVDWGEEVVPDMLEIFRDNNISITFFVSGRWAKNNPELLKEMYLAGHEIQSHGYHHKLCTQVSVGVTKEEILKTEAVILDVLGIKTTIFAPPSGDFDETTVELCKSLGYKLALWNVDTIDWREGSTASVIQGRVLKKPLNGSIILMHPKSETVKALPELIKEINKQNIEIVPLYRLPL